MDLDEWSMKKIKEYLKVIGDMGAGMVMGVHPFLMATHMKENISLISGMVREYIGGMTEESTMASFPKTSVMAKVFLRGLMALYMMETLSMDSGKVMVNTLSLMEDNTKGPGKMDATMVSERVRGKMVEDTVGNGGMEWPMDEALKPTRMEIFDMRESGSMMNPFVEIKFYLLVSVIFIRLKISRKRGWCGFKSDYFRYQR